jgi:hypothetical protein
MRKMKKTRMSRSLSQSWWWGFLALASLHSAASWLMVGKARDSSQAIKVLVESEESCRSQSVMLSAIVLCPGSKSYTQLA